MRECLTCGALIPARQKCRRCEAERQRNRVRPHYDGDYDRRAAIVRATPGPCHLCGEWVDVTLPAGHPLAPEADHVTPGDPASELRLAHRQCNQRKGARGTPPSAA
jgi:5-methylcytosine-specific restriction endonuclease McrA